MSDVVQLVHSHLGELQTSGFIATIFLLILTVVLLDRTASNLAKSRSRRIEAERGADRLGAFPSARGQGEGEALARAESRKARQGTL